MPGYVVHIVIAQEYLKKHCDKEQKEEFINGVIAPDLEEVKSKTHYGKSPAYTNLLEFLKSNEIESSFKRGYFLHLVTDYLFYNYYLIISYNYQAIKYVYTCGILDNKL